MKNKIYMIGLCTALLSQCAQAGINFGSRDSGFVLAGGGLVLGSADLSDGLIRDTVGGSVLTEGMSCSHMTFEIANPGSYEMRTMQVNGTVIPGTSIVLDEGDKLTVSGGRFLETVYVNGSALLPSVVAGYGEFDNNIVINNNSELLIAWNGQLNQNIEMTATNGEREETVDGIPQIIPADECVVRLGQNLEFTPQRFFSTNGSGNCFVNCAGYKILLGGDDNDFLSISHPITIVNTYLELTGPIKLEAGMRLEEGTVNGNNNIVRFSSIEGSYGFLRPFDGDVDIKNVKFEDVRPTSFLGNSSDEFNLHDCLISCDNFDSTFLADTEDSESEMLTVSVARSSFYITAEIHDDKSDFFVGDVKLDDANSEDIFISLNNKLTLNGRWNLTADATIRGNGHDLVFGKIFQTIEGAPALYRQGRFWVTSGDEESYVLRLEDITLRDVNAAAFETSSIIVEDAPWASRFGNRVLDLYNVHWIDDNNQHVCLSGSASGAVRVQLPGNSSEAGDLFGSTITFMNDAHIQLLSAIELGGTWSFDENAIIDGQGAVLDLASGSLAIANGKILTINNVTIFGATSASFARSEGYLGEIVLSDVTIILAENTTWESTIHVTGPLTVITGSYSLAGNNMVIDYGTAYYDTLDSADENNLVVDTGYVMHVGAALGGGSNYNPHTTGTITINGNASLDKNEYLFPSDEIDGRDIVCTGSGVYNGHGRTIFFPYSEGFTPGSATVLTVQSGQTLVTNNMIIDGLVPTQHLSTVGGLYFGHDTLVRLNQDVTLDAVLRFGSEDETSSEENMVLDLQGHTLDLGTGWIQLYGGGSDGNVLTIRNGRILVRDSDLLTVAAGNTLVLEDVEIVLMSTNWLHDNGNLRFEGHCRISGDFGNTVIFTSAGSMYIGETATLTLCDGIVWSQSANHRFYFASPTATLELIGATLRHPDSVYNADAELVDAGQLFVSYGRIIIDHTSSMQPGLGGIYLVDNLDIELRPGAILTVGINDVENEQRASAGTLVYGAD